MFGEITYGTGVLFRNRASDILASLIGKVDLNLSEKEYASALCLYARFINQTYNWNIRHKQGMG